MTDEARHLQQRAAELDQLRRLRRAAGACRECSWALDAAGFHDKAAGLAADAEKIDARLHTVLVPCVTCPAWLPYAVLVGDDLSAEPRSAICAPCDTRITEEVTHGR